MSLTRHKDESVTISEARRLVLLEATWEIDALALLLPKTAPQEKMYESGHLAVRGIAGRMRALSSILMSGLEDADSIDRWEAEVMVRNGSTGAAA